MKPTLPALLLALLTTAAAPATRPATGPTTAPSAEAASPPPNVVEASEGVRRFDFAAHGVVPSKAYVDLGRRSGVVMAVQDKDKLLEADKAVGESVVVELKQATLWEAALALGPQTGFWPTNWIHVRLPGGTFGTRGYLPGTVALATPSMYPQRLAADGTVLARITSVHNTVRLDLGDHGEKHDQTPMVSVAFDVLPDPSLRPLRLEIESAEAFGPDGTALPCRELPRVVESTCLFRQPAEGHLDFDVPALKYERIGRLDLTLLLTMAEEVAEVRIPLDHPRTIRLDGLDVKVAKGKTGKDGEEQVSAEFGLPATPLAPADPVVAADAERRAADLIAAEPAAVSTWGEVLYEGHQSAMVTQRRQDSHQLVALHQTLSFSRTETFPLARPKLGPAVALIWPVAVRTRVLRVRVRFEDVPTMDTVIREFNRRQR